MVGNPAWRFLPRVETAQSERDALFERANAAESVLQILNTEFGCDIPEYSDSKSWKFHCPWEVEHPDGGIDRAARFYWDGDRAFCFADHGVLDVVGIRSLQWKVSHREAAKRIVAASGSGARRLSWRERVEAHKEKLVAATQPQVLSVPDASKALHGALCALPGFTESQYRTDVRAAVARSLALLDPSWDFETVCDWINATSNVVSGLLQKGDG